VRVPVQTTPEPEGEVRRWHYCRQQKYCRTYSKY